jgi:hypothetical protein
MLISPDLMFVLGTGASVALRLAPLDYVDGRVLLQTQLAPKGLAIRKRSISLSPLGGRLTGGLQSQDD